MRNRAGLILGVGIVIVHVAVLEGDRHPLLPRQGLEAQTGLDLDDARGRGHHGVHLNHSAKGNVLGRKIRVQSLGKIKN